MDDSDESVITSTSSSAPKHCCRQASWGTMRGGWCCRHCNSNSRSLQRSRNRGCYQDLLGDQRIEGPGALWVDPLRGLGVGAEPGEVEKKARQKR